ncbi:MAG TPA: enoyl-CoA hydratase/isomerase family protein [Acidimicrobiia bacterium]|nr:enoyl-CoA hydratase/isomerase family protein [Acidimicrobiia bacterium]
METLLLRRDDSVATLTFNRPEKKNAINQLMWRELVEVLDELEDDPSVRVLVLTGAGDAFTSGADLSPGGLGGIPDSGPGGYGGSVRAMRIVGRVALRLHELHLPTIAAVNGVTTGAGCNLALGCDLIVAADTARFSEIFARRGLSLDAGGSWLLPRLIGLHRAKQLAYLADIISAAEAKELGLVNWVIPAGELMGFVDDMARRIAAQAPFSSRS